MQYTITLEEQYVVVELFAFRTVPWVCLYDAKRLDSIVFHSKRNINAKKLLSLALV